MIENNKISKIFKIIILLFCININLAPVIASTNDDYSNPAGSKIYIFVSYSLADSALQDYFYHAQQKGAILVMRGLINNSFLDTQAKSMELAIEYDIDPELFTKYSIESVPVIIRETGKKVEKVTGHISLDSALEIFDDAK